MYTRGGGKRNRNNFHHLAYSPTSYIFDMMYDYVKKKYVEKRKKRN